MRTATPIAMLLAVSAARAQSCTDTFENGVNLGGWSFGGSEAIQGTLGSWGLCLNGWGSSVTIPYVRSAAGAASPFTGDYRARRISLISARLVALVTDLPVAGLRPAIILVSENGTPGNTDDDWGAYRLSDTALGPQFEWRWHPFPIPSQSISPPPGWQLVTLGAGAPTPDWNVLIQRVDRVMFCFGDPSGAHAPQYWDVAADELAVSASFTCYVNCDNSTGIPCLNVLDFMCFLNRFGAGDTWANCDFSATPPALNVLDFACFLDRWAGGCTGC